MIDPMPIGLEAVLVLAVATVLALALVGLLHLFRGRSIRRFSTYGEGIASVSDPEFRREIELLTRCRLTEGTASEVLLDGEATFPRLWDDLSSATTSITIQQYFAERGLVLDTLFEIVRERAGAGVSVLLLLDSIGLKGRLRRRLRELEESGVQARVYRPARISMFGRADSRLHCRGVVIDGVIGYTGGFGLSDKWFRQGGEHAEWRDTNVRFTGPAVLQLQAAFAAVWAEATGLLLSGDRFFPPVGRDAAAGTGLAALLHMPAGFGSTIGERFIVRSFGGARRRLFIANAYFVPDDDLTRLLVALARGGVDVRIITASERTDLPITRWAGRSKYERLLGAGVRIFEYQPAMMHAKTFVVDGRWATVGAVNLDVRSMSLNEETTFVALDPEFAARMEEIFHDDLARSREIDLEAFRRRGWHERVLERGSAIWTQVL